MLSPRKENQKFWLKFVGRFYFCFSFHWIFTWLASFTTKMKLSHSHRWGSVSFDNKTDGSHICVAKLCKVFVFRIWFVVCVHGMNTPVWEYGYGIRNPNECQTFRTRRISKLNWLLEFRPCLSIYLLQNEGDEIRTILIILLKWKIGWRAPNLDCGNATPNNHDCDQIDIDEYDYV